MEIKEKQEMGRVESGDKGEAREGQTRQRRRPVLAQWHVWCAADRQDAGGGRCVGGGGGTGGEDGGVSLGSGGSTVESEQTTHTMLTAPRGLRLVSWWRTGSIIHRQVSNGSQAAFHTLPVQ